MLQDAGALTRELRELVRDHLQLASLETRLAARTAASMLATALALGLLLASVWLALMGAAVLTLIDYGFNAVASMAVGAGLNLVGALLLYEVLRYQSRSLGWPVTLSLLKHRRSRPAVEAAAAGA
ncbi:MAG: phage holin family protein [Pseudomonadales bacterium]